MPYPYLDRISKPEDLKSFDRDQLKNLAKELRARIIEVMSVNGGHLGSNLGSVELTLALHYVFNSPSDKFVFDVSHQTYSHKLLTGRQKLFSKIRKYQGLSGFANPDESVHDHFFAGHAGTALSSALGLAKARDFREENHFVIPIIGDATLTCGLTLEALNNLSAVGNKRFIVILNDNKWSIAENVGAITQILSRIISHPKTNKLRGEVERLLSKIPSYGEFLAESGHRLHGSLKNLVSPAMFFEQFGLTYTGPINGHDLDQLLDVLTLIKNQDLNEPVILHTYTEKGHGMEKAIQNPCSYHGVKPFDPSTGKMYQTSSSKPTFPKIFGKHLLEMAMEDPEIHAVTPAMPAGSSLTEFMRAFPNRCLDVGIAEGHSMTFSGALAYQNKTKVVLAIYSTFLQRALDNLFQDVCLQRLPVVMGIDRGGLSPADGSTHHGIYDISFLKAMPNMVIAQPRNGQVLKELFNSAFTWNQPTAIRYPNYPTENPDLPLKRRLLGTSELLSEGEDLLIIPLGHMYLEALEVEAKLKELGISPTLLDPVFVKPLDDRMLHHLLKTHTKVVTIEEHDVMTGLGNSINHFLIQHQYQKAVLNIGIPPIFLEQGSRNDLLKEVGLTAPQIFDQITDFFEFKLSKQADKLKELASAVPAPSSN